MILAKRKNKKEEYTQQHIKIIALFPNKPPNSSYFFKKKPPPFIIYLTLSKPLSSIFCRTSSYTTSGGRAPSTRITFPRFSKYSTTGRLVSIKTLKRFLMLSMLSSARPEVFPRLSSRSCRTSSGQSKNRVKAEGQTDSSNLRAWSILRGKPVVCWKEMTKKRLAGELERVWRDARVMCFI